MPRFFFHMLDGLSIDYIEGRELPDVAAAREQAKCYARDIASFRTLGQRNLASHLIVQVAGDGGVLLEVSSAEGLGGSA